MKAIREKYARMRLAKKESGHIHNVGFSDDYVHFLELELEKEIAKNNK